MNPSSGGWIKKYFSLTEDYKAQLPVYDFKLMPEEAMYGYLQPTGIMYGFPTQFLFLPAEEAEKWSNEEKFKVLLLESFIIADFLRRGTFLIDDLESKLERFVTFYEHSEIEHAKKSWLHFKDLDVFEKLESILGQRIDIKISLSNKLWTSYLHNSLVFQDLVLFFEYSDEMTADEIAAKRRNVMLDMMKVVAVAAHADGEIAEEEEALFDIFMASSKMSAEDREIARSFWDEDQPLSAIDFDYEMSWLLKRYFLEIATLMVWSDKIVVPSEQEFLDELGKRLKVDEDEQDRSFIAIQSFVMNNVDNLPFLSGQSETEQLMSTASNKWKKILGRNKDKISAELQQSKELVQLIAKSTTTDLSKEERKKVKNQFKDLAKTIPAFTLFMLPGGSLIMPIVLKMIPDLVPSAFRSNQVDEEEQEDQ